MKNNDHPELQKDKLDSDVMHSSLEKLQLPSSNSERPRLVVAGVIPRGTDPSLQSRLERYLVLNTQLPTPPMPTKSRLEQLKIAAPHTSNVLKTVADDIMLTSGLGAQHFVLRPLLLVGPSGSGKTWLARQLATLVADRCTLLYSLAGLNSAVPLRGQSRAFHESGPGIVADLLARYRSCGACVVWDEIDKVGTSDWNGNPLQALIQLLETETSRSLYDDFLQTTVNLSLVSYIATANSAGGLPTPVLARFRIMEVGRPPTHMLPQFVPGFGDELAERLMIPIDNVPRLDETAIARITRSMRREIDLREARRLYENEVLRLVQIGERGKPIAAN